MTQPLIKSISVKKLFGLYSYQLPQAGSLGTAAILYGDNGVGKSTILKLVFHLVSPAENKGHRTYLYNTEFAYLNVEFTNGVSVSADRQENSQVLVMKVVRDNNLIATWSYEPSDHLHHRINLRDLDYLRSRFPEGTGRPRLVAERPENSVEGDEAFYEALKKHVPVVFMLDAERRLSSDAVPDPSDEIEARQLLHEESKKIYQLAARAREIALAQALSSAAKWISRKAIMGANQGSTSVHTVYLNVLRHLTTPKAAAHGKAATDLPALQRRFQEIEEATAHLAQYELQTKLSTLEFRKALNTRAKSKMQVVADLLEPYVSSLEARIEALEPLYNVVHKFVTTLNNLLRDKRVIFNVSQGFMLNSRLGRRLEPAQLSSGEQQLILLFCYVLIGRDRPSVFIIDEPEISLNVKWQRQLIQSLLEITEGETIQFVFASHSLELLTQHRKSVVPLVNQQ